MTSPTNQTRKDPFHLYSLSPHLPQFEQSAGGVGGTPLLSLWYISHVHFLVAPAYWPASLARNPFLHCSLPSLSSSQIHRSLTADKVNFGIGLSYRRARQHGWRASTATLCRSWLYPPVRDLWIWLLLSLQPLPFALQYLLPAVQRKQFTLSPFPSHLSHPSNVSANFSFL